jgi:hypothetical protein
MTPGNKEFFEKFLQGKALATFKRENDLYAFLGMCECKDVTWRSGEKALDFIPSYKTDLRLYHTDDSLTYSHGLDGTNDHLDVLLFCRGEFSYTTHRECREMTLEEIEEALGHPIRIVTTH